MIGSAKQRQHRFIDRALLSFRHRFTGILLDFNFDKIGTEIWNLRLTPGQHDEARPEKIGQRRAQDGSIYSTWPGGQR